MPLQYRIDISYSNGFGLDSKPAISQSYTQTNQLLASGIQTIGTSAEALDTADVGTTGGWLWMRNLATTGLVTFGPDSSGQVTVGRLAAGQECWFFLAPSVTLMLTAATTSQNVQFKLFAL